MPTTRQYKISGMHRHGTWLQLLQHDTRPQHAQAAPYILYIYIYIYTWTVSNSAWLPRQSPKLPRRHWGPQSAGQAGRGWYRPPAATSPAARRSSGLHSKSDSHYSVRHDWSPPHVPHPRAHCTQSMHILPHAVAAQKKDSKPHYSESSQADVDQPCHHPWMGQGVGPTRSTVLWCWMGS